jgi:hypothetical protein
MNILRRVAQVALDLTKIQTEALLRLYGRLGLYKKLYTAGGLPEAVAARIEEKMIGSMFLGVEEQHALVSRWLKGETNLADFLDRYGDWFREYMDRCGRIVVEAVQPAV